MDLKEKKVIYTHDQLFKDFYSDPKLSRDLLRLIFTKNKLKNFDLDKLKIEKDTLKDKKADLIISVPFRNLSKVKLELFVVVEHKSQHDKNLFTQLLKYQVLLRDHTIKQKGLIQPVIPVLFYHGKKLSKWGKSLLEDDFKGLLSKMPIDLRRSMLNFELRLIDTNDPKIRRFFKDKSLKSRGILKLMSGIWDIRKPKAVEVKDVFSGLTDITKGKKGKQREELVLRIFEYLQDNTKLDLDTWQEVEKLMIEDGLLTRGGVMDIREHIKEKGRWEGVREGMEKGIEKGMEKGKKSIVLKMLKKKLGVSAISEYTGLSKAEIQEVKDQSNGKVK